MMRASEARDLTNTAIVLEVEVRRKKAEKFCEELTDIISNACKSRLNDVTVTTPKEIIKNVVEICKDNGYTVTVTDVDIRLTW